MAVTYLIVEFETYKENKRSFSSSALAAVNINQGPMAMDVCDLQAVQP